MKFKLYKYLRFNPLIHLLPYEDVMQELAIIEYLYLDFKEARRAANNAIYRLATKYGFSRKKGKDNFMPFYQKYELSDEEKSVINNIENLYINNGLTAREVATIYNIEFNNQFAKILNSLFSKDMGLGGARKNSGRKKQYNGKTSIHRNK